MKIEINRSLLENNDELANELAEKFRDAKVFVLNIISSPGAGKTTLLERTLGDLKQEIRFGVIEGDLQTDNDGRRIAATGTKVHQINTNRGCHLDAHMICAALDNFDLDSLDVLVIENVGNLVCPVEFYCGEDAKIALLSVPEGDDKPEKYPFLFSMAGALIINKIDLLPFVDFSMTKAINFARHLNPELPVFPVSSKTGEGMQEWYAWLRKNIAMKKSAQYCSKTS